MNLCNSIKLEYENLKKLKEEFVVACQKAGDLRVIPASEFRTLQLQKQVLERARDDFEKKLENTKWKG